VVARPKVQNAAISRRFIVVWYDLAKVEASERACGWKDPIYFHHRVGYKCGSRADVACSASP